MVRWRLSARTTNMPGLAYTVQITLSLVGEPFLGIEELLRHLAEHQADIELALLQQRHVLDAAAGRHGLYADRRIGPLDGVDEGACIDDEATALARGAELHAARLRRALARRRAGHRQPRQAPSAAASGEALSAKACATTSDCHYRFKALPRNAMLCWHRPSYLISPTSRK